ncbi:MAG: hypothetical protein CLLPBCKN_002630 [Chroococcidiopsis cubana SAG 39.79]|nr:hypothetical protein [Chroococcidiopsis cubana SAG 39.79]
MLVTIHAGCYRIINIYLMKFYSGEEKLDFLIQNQLLLMHLVLMWLLPSKYNVL